MEDLTGKQFGPYQIVAPLGEGGMAAVYKAYQPSMERHVALKVLPKYMSQSQEFVLRFQREARLLAQLQHPHILPVFDYGEADGYPYIVMPFIRSGTLTDVIRDRQPPLSEVRRIILQVGKALSFAHTRGMIHRDIKPSNVLIDEDGNCLLTDFGLARMLESSVKITSSDAIMGTPAYMSPEQGMGNNVDQRSDIYSLGVILYEMLAGRVPYTAETPIAVVYKHIHDPLPSIRTLNPALPEAVELILRKALAKNPDERYQTADELVRAVQAAIPESEPGPALTAAMISEKHEAASIPPRVSSQPGSSPNTSGTGRSGGVILWAVAGFAALGIFAVLAIVGVLLFNSQSRNSSPTTAVDTPISAPTDSSVSAPTEITQPTSTTEAVSMPTTTVFVPDDMLSQYLSDYTVVSTDGFDDPNGTGWDIQAGRLEDGKLVIFGNDAWNGVWRSTEFEAGQGLLIEFSYSQGSTFTMHLNNGLNGDPYRRFGLYFENDFPMPDLYIKDFQYEEFNKASGFQPGRTYTLLIARVSETQFLLAAWDTANLSLAAEHQKEFDAMPEGSSWTFLIQCPQGTVEFDNYAEFEFGGVK